MITIRCLGCGRVSTYQLWRNIRLTLWPIEVACRCGLARLVDLRHLLTFEAGQLALRVPFRVRWAP